MRKILTYLTCVMVIWVGLRRARHICQERFQTPLPELNEDGKALAGTSTTQRQNTAAAGVHVQSSEGDSRSSHTDGHWARSGTSSWTYSLLLHQFDENGEFIGKQCRACGEVKWLEDFYIHPTSHDGHENTCISCRKRNDWGQEDAARQDIVKKEPGFDSRYWIGYYRKHPPIFQFD